MFKVISSNFGNTSRFFSALNVVQYILDGTIQKAQTCVFYHMTYARLVIGTSGAVGSAGRFVRMASGFGGGEFAKTLRKLCACRGLKCSFLLLECCRVGECCSVANAFTIGGMYGLFLCVRCGSRRVNRPTRDMARVVTLLHF